METRNTEELREYLAVNAELRARGIHPHEKGIVTLPDMETRQYADLTQWKSEYLLQRFRSYQRKGENIGYMGEKRKQLVLKHGYDTKNAAHLIRLLRMCVEFLNTGELIVYRTTDASELLSIKKGERLIVDILRDVLASNIAS